MHFLRGQRRGNREPDCGGKELRLHRTSRPASTNATAVGCTVKPIPRSRIGLAFRKSKNEECSSFLYSSCASATRSHWAGLPGGGGPPLLHCDTSTVPGSYFRKSNPGTVPIPPTENLRSSGSSSPCSHPPRTSLPLIHVVGERRLYRRRSTSPRPYFTCGETLGRASGDVTPASVILPVPRSYSASINQPVDGFCSSFLVSMLARNTPM